MTMAYICDRCGRIIQVNGESERMHPIWLRNEFAREVIGNNEANVHLCDSCWEEFQREYLKNLLMESR